MISSARKAVVLLVATFVLGALAGAAGLAVAERRMDGPKWDQRTDWYLDHLTRSLELSRPQRDSVAAVLQRYRPVMDSLMQEIRPRLDTVRAAMRADVARHLDPAQQQEYDAMRQHREQGRKGDGHGAR